MIYLQSELDQFAATKELFREHYEALLESMFQTFVEKGKQRDTGSPIHHRQHPLGMLAIVQAKCRRVDALLARAGWKASLKVLSLIIEECVDAANYLLYIAALCRMLIAERGKELTPEEDIR